MGSEAQRMRSFVAKQLRECADISTLTKKKIRGRYLAHRGVDWISQEDWQHLKRIVEEELLKMEDTDSSDEEPLSKKVLSKSSANLKRKREAEAERTHGGRVEEEEEEEEEVAKKKKRPRVDRRSPDSADSGIERAGKVESEEEEEQLFPVVAAERQAKVGKRTVKHNVAKRSVGDGKGDVRKKERLAEAQGEGEHEEGDEDATEHASEDSDKEEKGGEASCSGTRLGGEEEEEDDDEKHPEMKKKGGSLPRCLSSSDSEGDTKGSGGADEKSEGESGEEGSMPRRTVPSSEEGQGMARAGAEEETEAGPGSLSDSSSLPSLDDDDDDEEGARSTTKSQQVKKKTKAPEDTDSVKGRKAEENRKVSRLKRYIALCGVRRNYKKLLDGCRSVKSQVAVLKKELEELGVVVWWTLQWQVLDC